MDLWHAEEAAQKAAQEAADKRERRARMAAQMAEDNRRQLEIKVGSRCPTLCLGTVEHVLACRCVPAGHGERLLATWGAL